ncbi:ATP-dependent RecD-like DNA helicase [Bradyrhizobium sp. Mp27]|uniref:ATP-dependent DNA helicase n=1 Tax=Bradyrhizobium sp. Mp27 TaxID=3042157 RepID=UPI00248AF1E9|nr:ATP-dependent RecD-like DNA helicase [Bradyrhizobium sp. Mp27]MDI2073063.1 ATP-dependent RecD-like DNA helicase [Bradyrhizobium sp. Mp27]
MPTHITARLAWHDDGWNGSICRQPEKNTYCVGCKSFPGDVIARGRNLDRELKLAGRTPDAFEGYVPPCCYSYNAFGLKAAPAASDPPDFFYGGASRHEWELPPATVSVWPYEAMYAEEVKAKGFLDNDHRRALTLEFFKPIQEDCRKNLIFYYANYSNPLSDEETPRYALIGVSRISKIGGELNYENVSEKTAQKYAGGMIWARDISSAYPDEGLRLPYHRYRNDPERLAQIALFPENPFLCKFGSKHVSDDEAIGLLEQFLDKVRFLKELGDDSENWTVRETWLLKVIAELWTHRGLYPGLLTALDVAGAHSLIEGVKSICARGEHQKAHKAAFEVLDTGRDNVLTKALGPEAIKKIARNWKLRDEGSRTLLRDVLPRLALDAETMEAIASKDRSVCGLPVSAEEISANPYVIAEMYCGVDASDRIPWSAIDRGVLPSPDLGGKPLADIDCNDERRFRALCVEHLRREPKHTFRFARELLIEIAERMDRLPAWKQAEFTERYFEVDADFLSTALTLRPLEPGLAIYLKSVFEDERLVEATLRDLVSRPDIDLRRPITDSDWSSWVYKPDSLLALKASSEYREATAEQAEVCSRLFRRPMSVVTGPAGTGKTTVIEALIRAVRRSEGDGASVLVLAPTGKAADRAREVFEQSSLQRVETVTVHSFLASNGWLEDNLTFKLRGGKRAEVGTLVLDEASMLDLELAAALFRAINWQHIRRLILVGDAGQLPPIGRGRVFADVIAWLRAEYPDSQGRLERNLRQLRNKAEGQGTTIVALSELFIIDDENKASGGNDASTRSDQEELISRIHAGGQVDRDLDVIYWDAPEKLAETLIDALEVRMKSEVSVDGEPFRLWRAALKDDPTAFQILTPHRGEMHGVEALNEACQKRIAGNLIERVGAVDGITLFDKVIQTRNRPKSNMIWAYEAAKRAQLKVEVYNGEIGTVGTMGLDAKVWNTLKTGFGPRLKRFAVQFTRKPGITVGYGRKVPTGDKYPRNESVEQNLELAYAVSIHKAQGSEFAHTFVIIPSSTARPVSAELVYTALTRASRHCTLLIQRDINSLLDARRRENAQTPQINSYLFALHVAKEELTNRRGWYESGKIHEALSGDMLRSKSEVIIANLLHEREIPFRYEQPLFAGDGTLRLPDFTITWRGLTYYWEHLGMLEKNRYAEEWKRKRAWYEKWFPGKLVTTEEGPHLSRAAADTIGKISAV